MPSHLWDHCNLDSELLAQIDLLQEWHNNLGVTETTVVDEGSTADAVAASDVPVKINDLQSALQDTEHACRTSLETLDGVLLVLDAISNAYDEITGRTNTLMSNCERLLEQQHTLQQTVEILKTTLQPFTDIEDVANLLGIPFDARAASKTTTTSTSLSTFYGTSNSKALDNHSSNLDPRSPEFIEILAKLSKAALFLQTHQDIMDKAHYQVWLERLQHRATSLVGRAMRDLIDKASKTCLEINQAKAFNAQKQNNQAAAGGGAHIVSVEDQPIESAPLYQKFRGLSFRLRELGALLLKGGYFNNADGGNKKRDKVGGSRGYKGDGKRSSGGGGADVVRPVMQEVKQGYVIVRSELLMPFMREAWAASLLRNGISTLGSASTDDAARASSPRGTPTQFLTGSGGAGGANSGASLCMGIRQAYSTLLRVTQLEQQLFDALFNVDSVNPAELHRTSSLDSSNSGAVSEPATPSSVSGVAYISSSTPSDSQEVLSIVETVSNSTRDFLRPLIIRESSVDELCRVVSTLSEDVRAQMVAMPVPQLLLKQLLKGLDGTVNDAKERLSYCAETRIRQDVQLFEPMPSQVKYPEILEAYLAAVTERNNGSNPSVTGLEGDAVVDVYSTWYPPMRSTLSLLSKLYGVVEMAVFEDFARRCLDLCVGTLRVGSERVKKSRAALHGDLFLIRHLLILREQLVPFEIRMQGTEKHLDFNNTAAAFTQMVANTQSLWRWDATNGLLLFASSGLPGMNETHVDAKKDLDGVLKQACFSLKLSALKMLLGPLDGFLAKVTAFSGEIPTESEGGTSYLAGGGGGAGGAAGGAKVALLSEKAVSGLKNQSFVRPERIKEMLEGVQSMLVQTAPELKSVMKLYIENNSARNILIKPILQEFELSRRKLETVIASCLDPGTGRRELETLLQTVAYSVVHELTQ